MRTKICPTCKEEYQIKDDEGWKKQCYECYKNFKGEPRIATMRERKGVLIVAHPTATEEEINEWIKKKYGSVNDPSNWGAVEMTGRNMKVWFNNQNCD